MQSSYSPPSVPGPRLLVVEDNEPTRSRLTELLLREGCRVDQAVDGAEGLRKVGATKYDAILLDLIMPNVDGWTFRETVLRHPEMKLIPTVVLTVKELGDRDRYVLRTPFVLQKPFADSALRSMVREVLHRPEQPAPATAAPDALFWSKRGEVACAAHMPDRTDPRWLADKWTAIPKTAGKGRVLYQCQHCGARSTPIQHRSAVRD